MHALQQRTVYCVVVTFLTGVDYSEMLVRLALADYVALIILVHDLCSHRSLTSHTFISECINCYTIGVL